ncbi:hypothetical protein [Paraburkholderia caribensis]|uniref:hypothetical protein n=1 Tax=Paraburkholderia caribensis TaxID=75105 RepID=UPI00078B386F|nr:hypothetical protein [Paraburkholderia caribensis]AMV44341.1 hypothetical protein ATN79_20580 [Paraburkholderia caribensis]
MGDFFKSFIKSPLQVISLLAGIVIFVLGSGQFDKLPVIGGFHPDHPTVMLIFGVGLAIVGIGIQVWRTLAARNDAASRRSALAAKVPSRLNAADFDVRIISHSDNGHYDKDEQTFRGTIKRQIPAEHHLWLVRRFAKERDLYFPEGRATVKAMRGTSTEFEWEVHEAYVGGKPRDGRIIEMWITGPDGHILLDAIKNANVKHARLMEHTKTPWEKQWLVERLDSVTSDMVLGTSISLIRQ